MSTIVDVRIRLDSALDVPKGHHEGSNKYDLVCTDGFTILSGESYTVLCGFALDVPEGVEMQIRSSFTLASRCSIVALNAPGSIDHTCKNSVKVLLFNHSKHNYAFKAGETVAYAVFTPLYQAEFIVVEKL